MAEKMNKDVATAGLFARTSGMEMRTFDASVSVECRDGAEGESKKIHLLAAVYEKWSVPLGGFTERFRTGAFRPALKNSDIRALLDHDPSVVQVLGRESAGTLKVWEDSKGLWGDIDPPDTNAGRDAVTLIDRGDVKEASIGFRVAEEGQEWKEKPNGDLERDIIAVDYLRDIAPVAFAAYPQTTVDMRVAMELFGVDVDATWDVMKRARIGKNLTDAETRLIHDVKKILENLTGVVSGDTVSGVTHDAGGVKAHDVEHMRAEFEHLKSVVSEWD